MTGTENQAGNVVFEALLGRPSVVKLRAERPPRALIEQLLQAAVTAPNHYLNQPWRFIVVTGDALEALGEVFAQRVRRLAQDPDSAQSLGLQEAERRKLKRSPVVIAVAAIRTGEQRALRLEDIAARLEST